MNTSTSTPTMAPAAPVRPLRLIMQHRNWAIMFALAVFPWLAPNQSVAINILIYGL